MKRDPDYEGKYTDEKAWDAVVKARTVLIISQPFFGALALHLNMVECTDENRIDTMAVDGINMYHHPAFIHELNDVELQGVVAHEVMHCALQHITRRGYRDHMMYNIAGDFVINADLKKAGFTLPGKAKNLNDILKEAEAHLKGAKPNKEKAHLHDPQFDGMGSEEVYERIKQAISKRPQLQQLMQQAGSGQGKKNGKGQGQGQGKGQAQGNGQGGGIDLGRCGGVLDAAGSNDKHKNDQVAREWDATVRMAVAVAKRANAGNIPGYLQRLVSTLEEARVSWRDLTRQFIDQSMTKDYSWARPNRRHVASGLHLPGFVPDALHHLVFVVDTSGSITNEMLQAMVSEMAGALADGVADKLTVLYADTEVRHVDEWVPGDVVTAKIHGGGGTDFADSFKWLKKNAEEAQCIIYLTDGLTGDWGEDIGIPTMWAIYLPQSGISQLKPPFGMIVPVDTSE